MKPRDSQNPLIIAGPCSAETEEQVRRTAAALKASGRVDVFRAGIWKPRTRPNTFEGVGYVGLEWLRQVKLEFGFPVAVEVAHARHVHEALKWGIDILWIGARTTVNPFAVQEIVDALKGVSTTLWIKNPVNADLELWLGALERADKAGIRQLGAIHRGFSGYPKSVYRNWPLWDLALELRRRVPHVPLVCDPSHICGTRDTIREVARKALDLHYDGLMIESHISPSEAWSDAQQQVTPEELSAILDRILYREHGDLEPLEELRSKIDRLDRELLNVLAERMAVSESIGLEKLANALDVHQPQRWEEALGARLLQGRERNLEAEFVSQLFAVIHDQSLARQREIMKKKRGMEEKDVQERALS